MGRWVANLAAQPATRLWIAVAGGDWKVGWDVDQGAAGNRACRIDFGLLVS